MKRPATFRRLSRMFAPWLTAALLLSACDGDGGAAATTSKDATTQTDTSTQTDAPSQSDVTDAAGTVDVTSPKPDTTADTKDAGKDASKPKDDDFDGAVPLAVGATDGVADFLEPQGDVDFHAFEGKKGQFIALEVDAQDQAFDPGTIDVVMTVYGPDKKQIAFNDDPVPRTTNDSRIYTVLPADGQYYVRIEECNTWAANQGLSDVCGDPEKLNTEYTLFVYVIDQKFASFIQDAEKGSDVASATAISYVKSQSGSYFLNHLWGFFTDPTDVDVFLVKVPADAKVDAGDRLNLSFESLAAGEKGNGSTSNPGLVWLASATTPTQAVAMVDMTLEGVGLSTPVTATETYYLFVPHPGKTKGTNDFYDIVHYFGGGNPVEKSEPGNDGLAGAEVLKATDNSSGGTSFFVEGDLPGATDVDHFSIDVSSIAGKGKVSVSCAAERDGSGLRGLSVDLLDETGKLVAGAVETATKSLTIKDTPVTTGAKTLVFKVTAKSVDAKVASAYYRCGAHLTENQ